jgi:hypothetical protein
VKSTDPQPGRSGQAADKTPADARVPGRGVAEAAAAPDTASAAAAEKTANPDPERSGSTAATAATSASVAQV